MPPVTSPVAQDLEILARLDERKVKVNLGTRHICCLYAINAWLHRNVEASLSNAELREVVAGVLSLIDQDGELPEKRITHTLDDLRQGQLLVRTDSRGLTSAGRWSVSPLAQHIVRFFVDELTLDEQSLVVTTITIRGLLRQIEADARKGGDGAWWLQKVTQPLDIVVGELVQGIDRRRRGLDARQEGVRKAIREQLEMSWEEGLDAVERLLATTADTIDELHAVVLRELDALDTALGQIDDLAEPAGAAEATLAIQRLRDQLFQLRAWSSDRHAAWSGWYQRVQRNTRELIRLDPNRRISARLRDHLRSWEGAPWALQVPAPLRHRPLRSVSVVSEQPPVTGARPIDAEPAEQEVDQDVEQRLRDRLRVLLEAHGALSLRAALAEVLPEPSLGDPFGAIGVVAHHLVEAGRIPGDRRNAAPWVEVPGGVEVENIEVSAAPAAEEPA